MMNFLYTFLFNPSYRLKLNYRLGVFFLKKKNIFNKFILGYLRYTQTIKRNCQISYKAKINKSVEFPHPLGIVIGDNTIIGENVKIWQQVTLGSHGRNNERLDYPIIEDDVHIYSGAKIIGGVRVGKGAKIGTNAVVIKDVPPYYTAVGIPAKNIKYKN